jgi:DNA-binding Lrp family transcriptional regulator
MMAEPAEILQSLFDKKIVAILKLFLRDETKQYYLREISKLTKVSPASTYRILNKLVQIDVLKVTEIKTAKLYTLQTGKTVDFLKSFLEVDIVQFFVDNASAFSGVEEILLLTKDKTKANLLILGNGVDTGQVKALCGEIRDKYTFTLNQMCLTREQYEQMSSMGLYPGSKKVMFRR